MGRELAEFFNIALLGFYQYDDGANVNLFDEEETEEIDQTAELKKAVERLEKSNAGNTETGNIYANSVYNSIARYLSEYGQSEKSSIFDNTENLSNNTENIRLNSGSTSLTDEQSLVQSSDYNDFYEDIAQLFSGDSTEEVKTDYKNSDVKSNKYYKNDVENVRGGNGIFNGNVLDSSVFNCASNVLNMFGDTSDENNRGYYRENNSVFYDESLPSELSEKFFQNCVIYACAENGEGSTDRKTNNTNFDKNYFDGLKNIKTNIFGDYTNSISNFDDSVINPYEFYGNDKNSVLQFESEVENLKKSGFTDGDMFSNNNFNRDFNAVFSPFDNLPVGNYESKADYNKNIGTYENDYTDLITGLNVENSGESSEIFSRIKELTNETHNYNNSGGNISINMGGVTQNFSSDSQSEDIMELFVESLKRGLSTCGNKFLEEE